MRTTRSIALTVALAAAPLAAVSAPAVASESPSVAVSDAASADSSTTSSSSADTEDKDEDGGFPWGLLGLGGLLGLLGLGGRKKAEPEIRTADHVRQTETYRPTERRDDVRVVEGNSTDTYRTNGVAGKVDDRFGDGDGRLDGDDLRNNRR